MSRAFDACRQSILDRPVNWGDKSNAVDGRAIETRGSPNRPYHSLNCPTPVGATPAVPEPSVATAKVRMRNSAKTADAVYIHPFPRTLRRNATAAC